MKYVNNLKTFKKNDSDKYYLRNIKIYMSQLEDKKISNFLKYLCSSQSLCVFYNKNEI